MLEGYEVVDFAQKHVGTRFIASEKKMSLRGSEATKQSTSDSIPLNKKTDTINRFLHGHLSSIL
jgi:hypothetical protein